MASKKETGPTAEPETLVTKSPIYQRRSQPPAQINQSLRDGIECLLEIASMERPVGSRELARRLDQDHSRVNRIISTLAYMGLADQTPDRKYVPGSGLLVLAALGMRGSPMFRTALPHLEELCTATGYKVALGMRWRTNVCYLYHGDMEHDATLGIGAEGLYPADRSSIGIVLLSQLEDKEISDLYGNSVAGLINFPDMDQLMASVHQARAVGYAQSRNRRSIAVALGNPATAGIALYHNPEQDEIPNEAQIPELLRQLNQTANKILLQLSRY
jgi:DNA-binding IclR family transcriptional regulator